MESQEQIGHLILATEPMANQAEPYGLKVQFNQQKLLFAIFILTI